MVKDILPPRPDRGAQMALAGLAASQAAAASRFEDYRLRRAAHTLRRQDADLALFARYLDEIGAISGLTPDTTLTPDPAFIPIGSEAAPDFSHDPAAWSGVT
jgi:hypothetical protein